MPLGSPEITQVYIQCNTIALCLKSGTLFVFIYVKWWLIFMA